MPRQSIATVAALVVVASLLTATAAGASDDDADRRFNGETVHDKFGIQGADKNHQSPKPGPVTVKGKNPKAPGAGSSSNGTRGPKFIWDTTTVCNNSLPNSRISKAVSNVCGLVGNAICKEEDKNKVFAIGLGGDGSKPVDCVGLRKNTGPGTQGAGTPAPPPPTISTEDFQSLTIPASTLKSQLGGFTLKGAHTNLYADGGTQHLDTIVLGQPVTVKATPISYTFTYGDGTKLTTKTPGAPVAGNGNGFDIQTETSHIYTTTGIFTATLTTTYTGQFSVNNGPYQPIPGTANTTSTPLNIDVWRTKHYRVAEPCNKNNTAPGCTPNR